MSSTDVSELNQRRLLQSIVEGTRGLFGAAAASVFLVDAESEELVFEAVAGEGEGLLPGTRFPMGTGIAGWTVMCGQPLLVDDLAESPQFARDAAESTGYVPQSIMAAPLFRDGDCIGVIEVLDRNSRPRSDPDDLASLGLLATETSAVLALLVRLRALEEELGSRPEPIGEHAPLLRRLGQRLPSAPDPIRSTVVKLLAMADEMLGGDGLAPGA